MTKSDNINQRITDCCKEISNLRNLQNSVQLERSRDNVNKVCVYFYTDLGSSTTLVFNFDKEDVKDFLNLVVKKNLEKFPDETI